MSPEQFKQCYTFPGDYNCVANAVLKAFFHKGKIPARGSQAYHEIWRICPAFGRTAERSRKKEVKLTSEQARNIHEKYIMRLAQLCGVRKVELMTDTNKIVEAIIRREEIVVIKQDQTVHAVLFDKSYLEYVNGGRPVTKESLPLIRAMLLDLLGRREYGIILHYAFRFEY